MALQLQLQLQLQLPLHDTTVRYTNYITLHYNYNYTVYTTLDYTTLYQTTLHNTTVHPITVRYTNYTMPQVQLQLHYTTLIINYLHHIATTTTTTTALHHTTLHPAVAVRWPLQPLQPLPKTQLQPPFGPLVGSLFHPWFTTTNLSYRFPIFETSATALRGTSGNMLKKRRLPQNITIGVINHYKLSYLYLGGPNSYIFIYLHLCVETFNPATLSEKFCLCCGNSECRRLMEKYKDQEAI